MLAPPEAAAILAAYRPLSSFGVKTTGKPPAKLNAQATYANVLILHISTNSQLRQSSVRC